MTLPTNVPHRPPATLIEVARQTLLRAREGHLSAPRQLVEMIALRLFYGLGPRHYHVARYWRKELSWKFKTGFWTYGKFRHHVNRLNSPAYQKLSQNKISEKSVLQLLSIPTPAFLGRLNLKYGCTSSGSELKNGKDLIQLLVTESHINRFCCKVLEGYGGEGFRAVGVVREPNLSLRMLDSGETLSAEDFCNNILQIPSGADYTLEEYVQQHPDLNRLNPSSVNTLRIWILSNVEGASCLGAFLRVGRRGSIVDNTSQGALAFAVDTVSGEIGEGQIKNIWNDRFECHMDSGERISGTRLPFLRESIDLAVRAVDAFPHIQFAGVDIAITTRGPVVIELNVEPDPSSAIIFDRSHQDIFGAPVGE